MACMHYHIREMWGKNDSIKLILSSVRASACVCVAQISVGVLTDIDGN